ncbi:hypothetical protein LY625_13050 [Lysobacter sp. GX 14042]|uniref:hypothetical protein n=1 Tax=Lysobacter sp. GX 14042 TaxID=2907155 RepID=UPI001F4002F5|nr:hypothetical protein [Lysobacter sp. GX 14042]MCE7033529.1 hypothetical protein [Lysobacter sp. GX 14042]
MRQPIPTTLLALLLAAPAAVPAQQPEIDRPEAAPQAVGAVHTLRAIPEACVRLEGRFTGNPAEPYEMAAVRSSPGCQPRARFADADGTGEGWLLNDRITVPSAGCPAQKAVVRVWRHPGGATPPQLDAQGRARIYLDEGRQASQAGRLAAVTAFAATLEVEGASCD